jgi:phage-related protein
VDTSVRKVKFRGSSRADLRDFPGDARREAGVQLFQVQIGDDPDDWKPMETVGSGVREIRIREQSGAYRVMYVAKFAKAIYVLHCFQKKTQKTAPNDLALAQRRYKELVRELSQ